MSNATVEADVYVDDFGTGYCAIRIDLDYHMAAESIVLDEGQRKEAAEGIRRCEEGQKAYCRIAPAYSYCDNDTGDALMIYADVWHTYIDVNGLVAKMTYSDASKLADDLEGSA